MYKEASIKYIYALMREGAVDKGGLCREGLRKDMNHGR